MRFVTLLALLFTCFLSCKKEDDDPVIPDPTPRLSTFEGEIGVHDNSTILTSDHNLLICGNTTSGNCILNISTSGDLIWRKDIQGSHRMISGIAQSSDQHIFICGTDLSKSDVLLIKANPQGDTLWTKTYGGTREEWGDYIIPLHEGNILICGSVRDTNSPGTDGIYIVKLDNLGDTIWTRTYFEENDVIPFHVLQTTSGDILITGMMLYPSVGRKLYLLKLNAAGNMIWNKVIASATPQWGKSTIELPNGDLIICGGATDAGNNQVLLLKTDGQGNVLWHEEYGETYLSEIGNSIAANADGSFTITGSTMEAHSGQREILIVKVDQDGTQLTKNGFGHTLIDYGQNILKDENEDNLITGQYNGRIFFTRTDNNCVFK